MQSISIELHQFIEDLTNHDYTVYCVFDLWLCISSSSFVLLLLFSITIGASVVVGAYIVAVASIVVAAFDVSVTITASIAITASNAVTVSNAVSVIIFTVAITIVNNSSSFPFPLLVLCCQFGYRSTIQFYWYLAVTHKTRQLCCYYNENFIQFTNHNNSHQNHVNTILEKINWKRNCHNFGNTDQAFQIDGILKWNNYCFRNIVKVMSVFMLWISIQ